MSIDQRSSELVRSDAGPPIATLGGRPLLPNSGTPLDLNWVKEVGINTSAVERRALSQVARRTVKKEWQAAWLLRAITCMDLTTLSGDDTEERVRRLCAKAKHPLQRELVQKLGIDELNIKVAAACVSAMLSMSRVLPSHAAASSRAGGSNRASGASVFACRNSR